MNCIIIFGVKDRDIKDKAEWVVDTCPNVWVAIYPDGRCAEMHLYLYLFIGLEKSGNIRHPLCIETFFMEV
jgi:hypothetical protein